MGGSSFLSAKSLQKFSYSDQSNDFSVRILPSKINISQLGLQIHIDIDNSIWKIEYL